MTCRRSMRAQRRTPPLGVHRGSRGIGSIALVRRYFGHWTAAIPTGITHISVRAIRYRSTRSVKDTPFRVYGAFAIAEEAAAVAHVTHAFRLPRLSGEWLLASQVRQRQGRHVRSGTQPRHWRADLRVCLRTRLRGTSPGLTFRLQTVSALAAASGGMMTQSAVLDRRDIMATNARRRPSCSARLL
jgi:hypothetical protein